jgi:hypothetical protein
VLKGTERGTGAASRHHPRTHAYTYQAGTDTRYWGLQSSELNFPRPTYASISAIMMEDYYGPDWDRRYKVVAARNRCVVWRLSIFVHSTYKATQ